ncbi:hypothetical protein ElyMa_002530000 [Elysia marginata]|uniref:Uncharacterized protein n=1 Tax=Elysia marginata TaxID=1093978 RepID=A0AAV4GSV6_9GAST|nr:hypothetical protein ElyMa_002530000 [Elysia marginata]
METPAAMAKKTKTSAADCAWIAPLDRGDVRGLPPSVSRQKTYVVENGGILDHDTKKAVLRIVMMEVGTEVTSSEPGGKKTSRPVVLENQTTGEVSIHLDNIDNPDVINHIYNIVNTRRASLDEPANCSKRC